MNENDLGTFPFGNPVLRVEQTERVPKPVFILGVYGSAVYGQFKPRKSQVSIRYLPIANEPEICWSGGQDLVKNIISDLKIPKEAGKLFPELSIANGFIGKSLDKYFLNPLKIKREQVWICNLIPFHVLNKKERKSIKKYNDIHSELNLPKASIPTKKDRWNFINKKRFREIIEELFKSRAEVIITLGQQPLNWFLSEFDNNVDHLLNLKNYGALTEVQIESMKIKLLPLFHPKQLLKERNRDTRVGLLHYDWIKSKAKKIKMI